MIFQCIAGCMCLLACILQFAAHRHPCIFDPPVRKSARKITIIALLMAGVVLIAMTGYGQMVTPVFSLMLALFAVGQALFAMDTFLLEPDHELRKNH